jgi:polyphosphate glucokinase
MKILVIDIGGTKVKLLATGQSEPTKFLSGKSMTPAIMLAEIRKLTKDWKYDVISIGYPGVVKNGKIITEPHNLAKGWINFDFEAACKVPVKIMNDAAMQALGSYKSGNLLFLGLGTGLGTALIAEGIAVPMEVAHLPYRRGTFEDFVGARGLKKLGKKKWRQHVMICIERLRAAVLPDDIVIGGGNAKYLKELPPATRLGDNSFAFAGGFRMWEKPAAPPK